MASYGSQGIERASIECRGTAYRQTSAASHLRPGRLLSRLGLPRPPRSPRPLVCATPWLGERPTLPLQFSPLAAEDVSYAAYKSGRSGLFSLGAPAIVTVRRRAARGAAGRGHYPDRTLWLAPHQLRDDRRSWCQATPSSRRRGPPRAPSRLKPLRRFLGWLRRPLQ